MPKRKYDPACIKYGFIAIEDGGESLPHCVVCMKSLSNTAMKPSLLKRHLESNHAEKKDRGHCYFQRLKREAAAREQDWPDLPEGNMNCENIQLPHHATGKDPGESRDWR